MIRTEVADLLAEADAIWIFLGLEGDRAIFALDVPEASDPAKGGPLAGLGYFRDARMAGSMVSIEHGALIAQAKAMIDWHQRHGFARAAARQPG